MESADRPTLPWRAGYAGILGLVGGLTKVFMYGFNSFEVHGLDNLTDLLKSREDIDARQRGLITGTYTLGSICSGTGLRL